MKKIDPFGVDQSNVIDLASLDKYQNNVIDTIQKQVIEYRINHISTKNMPDEEVTGLYLDEMCSKGALRKLGKDEYSVICEDLPTIQ
jgi:hypothetical protein